MSLKTFHIVFITASSLLAFGFGAWCLMHHSMHGDATFLGLGIGSLVVGIALIVYGVWFYRKIRTPEEERRRRRDLFKTVNALAVGGLMISLSGTDALACTVCYGEAEGPLIDAAKLGVYLLFGLVAMLQASFVAFFVVLWRRSKRLNKPEPVSGADNQGSR